MRGISRRAAEQQRGGGRGGRGGRGGWCALCFVPFWAEWAGEWLGLLILSSFFAVHIAFVTCEAGLGYELKYRNWTMGLVWGTIVGFPVLAFVFGVLSG